MLSLLPRSSLAAGRNRAKSIMKIIYSQNGPDDQDAELLSAEEIYTPKLMTEADMDAALSANIF